MDMTEYTKLFHDFLDDFYRTMFDAFVKLAWLRRRFGYGEMRMSAPAWRSPLVLQLNFFKFLRRNIGKDIQIITKGQIFSKIEAFYLDLMFPLFDQENPFENPDYYKFPFKNITIDYLFVVHQMDDRMELLEEADKQNMTFAVFLDFVLNHMFCENERLGRDRYTRHENAARMAPIYVRDNDKIVMPVKGKKRKTCRS
jgi:hypothetical protein